MNLIIRKAKVIDATSSFNNQIVDILIENEIITKIGSSLSNESNYQEINFPNLCVSEGWFDSSVCLGEPGFEDSETIAHGLLVAAQSGFTAIALQPNTFPIIDNQSQVAFVKNKAQNSLTELFPIGALTKKSEATDLAELFDMKNAGAIAFGDYNLNIENPNLLKIALQYTQDFNGLVIAFCQDEKIKGQGVMNEGKVAMQLGLKGIPALAEELMVQRNLSIIEYTGGKLHFPTLSTAKSVELIKEAKTKGLQVSCSVAVHHLCMNDENLKEFDTRYKVIPPLRSENDRKVLITAVLDGTIDMITTDHNPINIEYKKMEFDLAKYGTIGLESAFGALATVLPVDVIVNKLTAGKSIFHIPKSNIAVGEKANMTLFSTEGNTLFSNQNILSSSKNSAFLGMNLNGQVYGTINHGMIVL
jgi:dihydroorotase